MNEHRAARRRRERSAKTQGETTYTPMASEDAASPALYGDFEALYHDISGLVLGTVLSLCGDRHFAEDATQEAFAKALERWDRLREKSRAGGWIMTTALNNARKARRRRALPAVHPGRDDEPSDPNSAVDSDARLDIWHAVGTLPMRQQEAIALHYVLDLPLDEVGRVMGCRPGTVKRHLWRARQTLMDRLEDDTHG